MGEGEKKHLEGTMAGRWQWRLSSRGDEPKNEEDPSMTQSDTESGVYGSGQGDFILQTGSDQGSRQEADDPSNPFPLHFCFGPSSSTKYKVAKLACLPVIFLESASNLRNC